MKNKYLLVYRIFFSLVFLNLLFSANVFAQSNPATAVPKYEIPQLKYPTADAFVISYNIMDFDEADNTGQKDMTHLIQTLLRKLEGSTASRGGVGNGGVLFLPEGKYLVTSKIIVPKGVTIRGEWQKPEKGNPIVGTIIVAEPDSRGREEESRALFAMEPSAAIKDLAFWYPKQDPNDIKPYPPTIVFGVSGYFGNEYCIAQNITLVNSYNGFVSSKAGGGAPNMYGIYGTPLKKGLEIDCIAEVGRIEGVDFSPEYWAGSGLEGSPSSNSSFKEWIRDNGTAIVMRRNDWSFTSNVKAEGYFIGFHAVQSTKESADPNGQNYLMTFTNCTTALYVENVASSGIMFHQIKTVNCKYGLFVPAYCGGSVQLTNCDIQASQYAIGIDPDASTRVLVNQCHIESGKIESLGGSLTMIHSEVDNNSPQIVIGANSRAIVSGNKFGKQVKIENNSMYECQIDNNTITGLKKIPNFPYKDPQTIKQKPEREVLYIATAEPFNAKNDAVTDNTNAIQQALNKARAEGGGIVYLPAGKYRINGNLTIPAGVELKGAMDVGSVPTGPGSVLEVYAGKGNEGATPFIRMEANSGVRGVVINYPEQVFNSILSSSGSHPVINPHAYPYAIQVMGKDAYIINVGFRATFRAIDLFSYKCDNTYIEYPAGHVFATGIRVGGGSENIRICNTQFNTIGYACGQESKFGRWPNSPEEGKSNAACYNQNYRDLHFFVLGDCKNLLLFNNFHYGSYKGTVFANEGAGPSGLALGHDIDSAVKALYYEKVGSNGFDLIGSQIVALQREIVDGGRPSRYIETSPTFTGESTLHSADFWGSPYYGIEIGGGNIQLQSSHFSNSGAERFAEIKSNGTLQVLGSSVFAGSNRPVNSGGEKGFTANSSILTAGNMNTYLCKSYENNLSNSAVMMLENKIDRYGWIASASKNNGNAGKAIDSDPSSRWDTGASMRPGDWFSVNMRKVQSFNKIILDQGSSSGDYPRGYEVYLSNDGKNWGDALVTGKGTSNITTISFAETQAAQYIKIVQTGSDGLYWSIHDFYIVNAQSGNIDYPTLIENPEAENISIYYAGENLFIEGLPGDALVNIYTISGQLVQSVQAYSSNIYVPLKSDIYIISIKTAEKVYSRKIQL
ncbi:discoidin domain-containing protein [Bacteroides sp. OttesenSCG-928-J23]|nr:discoidin domain-containing protein [Bacteroides sp. OttesenSCG-928-J23]MDL2304324.1 discoidin domain-containing protein [Bacteroides sp. OttesenSCG-928-D19]